MMKSTVQCIGLYIAITLVPNTLFSQQLNLLANNGKVILPCYNGETYFMHDDGQTGVELWKTDGNSISQVLDADPGPGSHYGPDVELASSYAFGNHYGTKMLAEFGGSLYYWGSPESWSSSVNGLWNVNGNNVTGIIPFGQIQNVNYLGGTSNHVYFKGYQQAFGYDILVSDGNSATNLDLASGNSSVTFANAANFGSELLVAGYGNNAQFLGSKLFLSNNGTLQEIYSTSQSTLILGKELNGEMYLITDDGTNGLGIYTTDGVSVQFEYSYIPSGSVRFEIWNNEMFIIEEQGQNIIKTDGNAFSVIPSSDNIDLTLGLAQSQNGLILWREGATSGVEPYCLNGNSLNLLTEHFAGSNPSAFDFYNLYQDINMWGYVNRLSSEYRNLVEFNDEVFYRLDTGNGYELWKTDGLTAEKIINSLGAISGFKYDLTVSGGLLYFITETSQGNRLFSYNSSVVEEVDISPVEPDSIIAGCNGDLYITGTNSQLYSYRKTSNMAEVSASNSIVIHPNPAEDFIKVLFKSDEEAMVQILDHQGRVVSSAKPMPSNGILDVSILPHGIYFLRVELSGEASVEKIIVN